jgi:hypothetical protein
LLAPSASCSLQWPLSLLPRFADCRRGSPRCQVCFVRRTQEFSGFSTRDCIGRREKGAERDRASSRRDHFGEAALDEHGRRCRLHPHEFTDAVALLLGRSASESGRLRHGEKILGWGRPPPERATRNFTAHVLVASPFDGGLRLGGQSRWGSNPCATTVLPEHAAPGRSRKTLCYSGSLSFGGLRSPWVS